MTFSSFSVIIYELTFCFGDNMEEQKPKRNIGKAILRFFFRLLALVLDRKSVV